MHIEWLEVYQFILAISWLTGSGILLQCMSLGKDQNSKLEVQVLLNAYHFHSIVKLKNHK